MQHKVAGGPGKVRKPLYWILFILIFWSLAASSFSPRAQGSDDTPTPTVQAVDTDLPSPAPSATPSIAPTVTLTIAPTARIRPTATVESQASDTPLPPAQLSGEYAPDEVLIRFRRKAAADVVGGCLQAAGASVESEIDELSVLVVKVPNGSVAESIAKLSACPETRLAEPNYLVHMADVIPSDPDWSAQYGLVNIRAPRGWSLSTGSPAVTIAIIDTGVDLGHPDLSAKIVGGHDFVNNDNSAQDDNGHGTHVAGIAAAVTNNGRGVAGVSWGARIMPVKVLDEAGNGTFADVAAGIIWASDQGAQVINLSLGGTSASSVLQDAVDYASAKGVVIVAAAGNYGANFVLYPAHYPNVIAVAATDSTNGRADFSDYGPEVDLAAPGVDILSTLPGGYGYLSGTSMSTPFVAGLAAILRGVPGSGSPDAIAFDMESTALDLGPSGPDSFYGYGLIQMDAAIRLVLPPTPTPFPSSTFAPRAGQGGVNYPTFLPGLSSPTPTFTPTPLPTGTPTSTQAMTATLSAVIPVQTAEVAAMVNPAPSVPLSQRLASKLGNQWPLGCGGSILILLGVWQVWALSRKGAHRRGGSQYFKVR